MAVRTHQESLPDQGRKDHACHHYQDDPHAGKRKNNQIKTESLFIGYVCGRRTRGSLELPR